MYKKKSLMKALQIAVWNKHVGEEIGKTICKCCSTANITQLTFHCAELNENESNLDNIIPVCELCYTLIKEGSLIPNKEKILSKSSNKTILKKNDNATIKHDNVTTETNNIIVQIRTNTELTKHENVQQSLYQLDDIDDNELATFEPIDLSTIETILEKPIKQSQPITLQQRHAVEQLLIQTKLCNRLFYLTKKGQKNWGLVATNGNQMPYILIYHVYKLFLNCNDNTANNDKNITHCHKKCNTLFNIDTSTVSIEYDQKIKKFQNHLECFLNDDEFIAFCIKHKFVQ